MFALYFFVFLVAQSHSHVEVITELTGHGNWAYRQPHCLAGCMLIQSEQRQ